MTEHQPFLREVRIRNYKSIESCQTRLGSFTLLVGRNGSGKSNFLDAIHFIADSLLNSLDYAVRVRGGVRSLLCQRIGSTHGFTIGVRINLSESISAQYEFRVTKQFQKGRESFAVSRERLDIYNMSQKTAFYETRLGRLRRSSVEMMPPLVSDRLYLVNAAGIPEFRMVYDALLKMGFYNLNPLAMKLLQVPNASEFLASDGSNIASVFGRLQETSPESVRRIISYLSMIVPDLQQIQKAALGPTETLEFEQSTEHRRRKLYATNMSDGTLRALGTLVAVAQAFHVERRIYFVGIEEPETALHPAASSALMDALREATDRTQVLVTTHSADLLDAVDPETDTLLGAESREGISRIATLDPASLQQIRDHLYSPGELLRMDQLGLDEEDISRQIQSEPFESFEKSP